MANCIWSYALKLECGLWIERVPSKSNISDDPSREVYDLMKRLGATFVPPRLAKVFYEPESWMALLQAPSSLAAASAAGA